MKPQYFSVPRSDKWIFNRIAISLATRLASLRISGDEYHDVTKLLYAIQSFPNVRADLSIYINWQNFCYLRDGDGCPDVESNLEIEYSRDYFYLAKDNVRLEYRRDLNKLLACGQCLTGEARENFLKLWIEEFDGLSDPNVEVIVENFSEKQEDVGPPLSEFCDENVRITANPFE